MAKVDDYKRQQELLFQQVAEKARIAEQAKDKEVADVLRCAKEAIKFYAHKMGISREQAEQRLRKRLRKSLDDEE